MAELQHASARVFLLVGTALVSGFAAFVFQVAVGRFLGPSAYGQFSASWSLVTLVVPLATFGIAHVWLMKYGSEGYQAIRWLRPSFVALAATVSSGLAVVFVVSEWLPPHGVRQDLLISLAPILVFYAGLETAQARLQAEERFGALAASQGLLNAIRLLMLGVAVVSGAGVTTLAAGIGVAGLMVGMLLTAFAFGLLGGRIRVGEAPAQAGGTRQTEAPGTGQLVREAAPFVVVSFAYLVYFQSDIAMLGVLGEPGAAGNYAAAVSILLAVFLAVSVVTQKFMLGKLHRWAAQAPERLLPVFRLSSLVGGASGLLLAIGISVVAQPLAGALFGPAFADTGGLLRFLAMAVPFRIMSGISGVFLLTRGFARTRAWLLGASALLNVVLNAALIPHVGAFGSAAATVASEVANCTASLVVMRVQYFDSTQWSGWLRPLDDLRAIRNSRHQEL